MALYKHPFPFDIEAENVMDAYMHEAGEKVHAEQGRHVSAQNFQSFNHGASWQSHHSYAPDRVDNLKTLTHETKLDLEDIALGRLGIIESSQSALVRSMADGFAKSLYEMISDVCEENGNVVRGTGSLGEQLLEALESIEFMVDRDGNVSRPEIRVGSGMIERFKTDPSLHSPELQARADAITALKTSQALEKEAARKSKFRKEVE